MISSALPTKVYINFITFPTYCVVIKRRMPNPPILKGAGPVEAEIALESVQATHDTPITHENLTTITSYNLLEKRKRTIIVPGTLPVTWFEKLYTNCNISRLSCYTDA